MKMVRREATNKSFVLLIKICLGPKVTCISKKNASAIAVTFEMKMSKVCSIDHGENDWIGSCLGKTRRRRS